METAVDAPENIDIDDASLYNRHAQTHTHKITHLQAQYVSREDS